MVAENLGVVVEAHPSRRLQPVELGEAPIGREAHRDEQEDDGADDDRRHQDPAGRGRGQRPGQRAPASRDLNRGDDYPASSWSTSSAAESSASCGDSPPTITLSTISVMIVSICSHCSTYGKWVAVAIVSR